MKKIYLIIFLMLPGLFLNAQEKKYEIEKGKVIYETTVLGSVNTITMYFKDYGRIQASDSEFKIMGMSTKNRTIEKDGYVYSLNLNKKTGIKTLMEEDEETEKEVNYDALSDEELTEYNAKREGSEMIAGKEATVYTLSGNGSENTFCMWKGIPLKWEANDEGMTVITIAKEVSEDPEFPEGIFEIPNDYQITEM